MAQKSPTVDDVLRGALALVKEPKTWTRRAGARDRLGVPLSVAWDARAVRWCAQGALRKVAFDLVGENPDADALVHEATLKLTWDSDSTLPVVNDYDGRKAVFRLFKKALAA